MPRPGPRPFECVKRSWHSDRHQPIRGSIIQQIFRVVHENHSSGTKKNREWQEKLPLVVLKSEEIMYSKANSEAEYVDPETLWDRLNDAIDTIIRKDESLETGELLPPCVEAALNLGCVPVRSSRSQRNSNTRVYLTPRNQVSAPTNTQNLNVQRTNVVNQTHTFPEASKDLRPNLKVTPSGSSFNPPSFENRSYPLYHGFHFQSQVPEMGFHGTHQNSNPIFLGTPVFQKGCSERLFPFDGDDKGSKKESEPELVECDLSLRLGFVSGYEKGLTCVDSSSKSKEFSFFPLNSNAEEVQDVRKRKTVGESQQFLNLDPGFNQVNERMKRRGL